MMLKKRINILKNRGGRIFLENGGGGFFFKWGLGQIAKVGVCGIAKEMIMKVMLKKMGFVIFSWIQHAREMFQILRYCRR